MDNPYALPMPFSLFLESTDTKAGLGVNSEDLWAVPTLNQRAVPNERIDTKKCQMSFLPVGLREWGWSDKSSVIFLCGL